MTAMGGVGRDLAFKARAAGAVAARDGKPVTDCPYDPDGLWDDRLYARFWIRGWTRAKRALDDA